jgi:hypothetical protein
MNSPPGPRTLLRISDENIRPERSGDKGPIKRSTVSILFLRVVSSEPLAAYLVALPPAPVGARRKELSATTQHIDSR